MKIGAEEKKKLIIMAVLLVIAVPLVIHSYSSLHGSASANVPAPSVAPRPATPTRTTKKGIPQVREGNLDPTLRTDILMASQKIQYTGAQRNIFRMYEPPVVIPAPADNGRAHAPQPPPYVEPPKPQIPLKFFGFTNRPGEPRKAFLQNGDTIFVAVEGDVVDRRYKVLKITNTFVLVEDVLNNNQQTINLTLPQPS